MIFRLIKDLALFLLVFGIINDDFVVDKIAGENALKAIFAFFLLLYARDILLAFMSPKNRVLKFFYFFIIVFSLVMFVNVLLEVITLIQAIFVLLPIIAIFVLVSYYENFEKLLYFIWASTIVSSIILVFSEPLTQWTFRRTGGTGDPNEFATHVLVASSITIYLFYKNRNYLFLLPSLGLFSYALLYAGSKSAFLTLLFLSVFALVVKFRFLLKKLFSLQMIVGIIILSVGFFVLDVTQMTAIKGMEERAKSSGTAKTRFVSWNAGVRMARDNFLTGVGAEQYEKHAREYATDFIAEGSFAPHNFLIKMIGENGIFPFFALVIFLFILFTYRFSEIMHSDYFWIYLAALATVLMGLTLSMTYEKYFWLFLGLLSHVTLVLWAEEDDIEEVAYEDHAYTA
jgi:O-antigen ligase